MRAARRIWARIDARAFRRQEPALLDAALPHPDRRVLADRAAAVQQHRARHGPGAGRRPGRHAVAAHQLAATRRWRCRPRRRSRSRCARSRSSPRSPAWPTPIDPLAGSYFVEALTDRMEREALDYIDRIDEMGGMVAAIETGFPQKEIADASYRYQRQIEQARKTVVGVNQIRARRRQSQPGTAQDRRGGRASDSSERLQRVKQRARRGASGTAAGGAAPGRRKASDEPDPADAGRRCGSTPRRRGLRGAGAGLRTLPGNFGDLMSAVRRVRR